jgi:hypothetical protein
VVEIEGLRIFGSPWVPWHRARNPGATERKPDVWKAARAVNPAIQKHFFEKIPENVDILMTHGPARGIFDDVGGGYWGSSSELRDAIVRARPTVHLFGHLHEQRGQWARTADRTAYVGGVEYSLGWDGPATADKRPFPTGGPPPLDYPCELVSCNAMKNHPGLEGIAEAKVAGPARLIVATGGPGTWSFVARPAV